MARVARRPLPLALVALLSACPGDDTNSGAGDTAGDGTGPSTVDGGSGGSTTAEGPTPAQIPQIKQGEFESGAGVTLMGVVMSSPEGTIVSARSYFVQDAAATEWAGLRVVVPPIFDAPSGDAVVDLTGTLFFGEDGGWTLSGEGFVEGEAAPTLTPVLTELEMVAPGGAQREPLADMLVRLDDPDGQTLWISDGAPGGFELSEQLTVNLSAFGVPAGALGPGAALSSITGLLMLDGEQTLLLPRSSADVVPAG